MIVGLLLAGGRSSRFGTEKAVAPFGDGLLMDRPLLALNDTCARVAVSARPGSGAERRALATGLTCLSDAEDDAEGPLAGIRAGLAWADELGAAWLATAPCDAPRLTATHYQVLRRVLDAGAPAASARSPRGPEPLVAIWPVEAGLSAVTAALADGDHPSVRAVLAGLGAVEVESHDGLNINRPGELVQTARSPRGRQTDH